MSSAGSPGWFRRRRRSLFVSAAALAALGIGAPQAWAWYHVRQARTELGRYHPAEARTDLDAALKVWDRPAVHLLASRAARQAGDFAEADRHLRAAQRAAGGPTDDIAFEWALLQAAAGNVREVDRYLQRRADDDPARTTLVWEALVEGYIRVYRTLDAMATLDHWLAVDPNNVRALDLRGMTLVVGKGLQRGSEDYKRALELDPDRDDTRWRLALCLLDLGGFEEALPHLERLARARPDDPAVQVRLARCQNMLGRTDEAKRLLDGVLANHPDDAMALRARGQFAVAEGKPADAEGWLRRAAASAPYDYQTQWLLFQALQQQGKTAEAEAQLKVADDVKDRFERLTELRSRRLAEQPLDPALHLEMGMLQLKNGRPQQAEWWFLSALGIDPDFAPAHRALADLYDQTGDKAKAAEHRAKAGS